MTRLQKNTMYDRICDTLTDYEENGFKEADELYHILCKIANLWEEITGEEED